MNGIYVICYWLLLCTVLYFLFGKLAPFIARKIEQLIEPLIEKFNRKINHPRWGNRKDWESAAKSNQTIPDANTIELGIGLGQVKFGMNPYEVIDIMGDPYPLDVSTAQNGMGMDELCYGRIQICFDRYDQWGPLPDSKFTSIIITNPLVLIYDRPLSDWNIFELVSKITSQSDQYVIRGYSNGYAEFNSPCFIGIFYNQSGRIEMIEFNTIP